MSSVDSPNSTHGASAPLSPEDLARVEKELEDIHLKETKSDALAVPPALFGAGGPMSAAHLARYLLELAR